MGGGKWWRRGQEEEEDDDEEEDWRRRRRRKGEEDKLGGFVRQAQRGAVGGGGGGGAGLHAVGQAPGVCRAGVAALRCERGWVGCGQADQIGPVQLGTLLSSSRRLKEPKGHDQPGEGVFLYFYLYNVHRVPKAW